jgi:hypothetical protein
MWEVIELEMLAECSVRVPWMSSQHAKNKVVVLERQR